MQTPSCAARKVNNVAKCRDLQTSESVRKSSDMVLKTYVSQDERLL